jgi:hypothetical protein
MLAPIDPKHVVGQDLVEVCSIHTAVQLVAHFPNTWSKASELSEEVKPSF